MSKTLKEEQVMRDVDEEEEEEEEEVECCAVPSSCISKDEVIFH